MEHQNWDTIYVHLDKKGVTSDTTPQKKQMSKETKLEKQIEEGTMSHKKTPAQFGKDIQRFRQGKKWTQKELAQKINQSAKIITDIENGTLKHNPKVISQLKRLMK